MSEDPSSPNVARRRERESADPCAACEAPPAPGLAALLTSVEGALAVSEDDATQENQRDELSKVAERLKALLNTDAADNPPAHTCKPQAKTEETKAPSQNGLGIGIVGRPVVLVVDEDPIRRARLVSQLEGAGLQALEAGCEESAAELMLSHGLPSLMLVDMGLAGEGGAALCRRVHAHIDRNVLPIILLTEERPGGCEERKEDLGASDYLVKPISEVEMLARVRTQLRLRELTRAYSRFVPKEFLKFLEAGSIIDVELGDYVEREMTVMFMDIRSFTSLSESMNPEQNFRFLNSYLQRVAPVIQAHGGFIDKYVGDGIMALFPDSPTAAVRAAVDIRGTIHLYNRHRANCNYRPIEIGVGVHTGDLILGTIGYADRMETTVISDSVNLASRLENLNKHFGSTVIISESTLAATVDIHPRVRYLGRVRVAGRAAAVPVFELFEGDIEAVRASKESTIHLFEHGVRLYEMGEIGEAGSSFEAAWRLSPEDTVARRFWERCVELQMTFGPRLARASDNRTLEVNLSPGGTLRRVG